MVNFNHSEFYEVVFESPLTENGYLNFNNSSLLVIEFRYAWDGIITINNSFVNSNIFSHIQAILIIQNSKLIGCEFINSKINNETFNNIEPSSDIESISTIDIVTLAVSADLKHDILKKIFNITSSEAQEYVRDFFKELIFYKIFVSFSFKDILFARRFRQELLRYGVPVWFWEEDAPGGKRLKDIMYKGIQDNDKVLFICSKDSLKSEACHFELSEARKKEEKNWEDILFPIAIDDTIFSDEIIKNIQKYKPAESIEWIKNIEWLQQYNILDFRIFNSNTFNTEDLKNRMDNLVIDLRNKKNT